jgi:hypothetical protein
MPGIIEKVNYFTDLFVDDCDEPFLVWATTALPPLGQLVLSLVSFGTDDIIRGYFRPKGLRSARHGRGGKKRGIRRSGLGRALANVPGIGDDTGNMIGKMLPGAQSRTANQVSQGLNNMWRIDGVIQRGLFYWFIADVVSEFLFDWATLIEQSEAGTACGAAALYATGDGGGFPVLSGFVAVETDTVVKQRGGCTWNQSAIGVPAGIFSASMSLTAMNAGTVIGNMTPSILFFPSDGRPMQQTFGGTQFAPPIGSVSLAHNMNARGPGVFSFRARAQGESFIGTSSQLWAAGR